jgi:RNA polymerase sigma factor (sigma-70 family)
MKNGLRKTLDRLRQSLTPCGISDGQLLQSFLSERDEAAFAALVRRHGPMVLGVCHRILRDPHDADDAFQATFLILVQKAASVANRQALASWLYTVAYRSALEAKIRNVRRQRRERYVAMNRPETAVDEPQDWRPVLDHELNGLPEKYRAPIVLCDLEGRPRREAARRLRLAEGTLSSRLATARKMLAQRLTRRGVTLSGGALAMSLSGASACVPPSLVSMTTKAALLIAAGRRAALSASISEILKGATQAMFLAKLKTTLTALMVVFLGAGTVVYCASGQTATRAKPPSELEALRHENELLKINLRITLEKIKALEGELIALKGRAKDEQALLGWRRIAEFRKLTQYAKDPELTQTLQKALGYMEILNASEMDQAIKLFREAKDAESRQKALDRLEKLIQDRRRDTRPAKKNQPTP